MDSVKTQRQELEFPRQRLWGSPFHSQGASKRPDIFGDYFPIKASLGKHLKEKCSSDHNQKLSFKYFVNFHFIPKLFSKVSKIQTTFS